MTEKEIVQALRCISTQDDVHEDCTGCPYYKQERWSVELEERLLVDTWPMCDCNKACMDAADRIERLTAENAKAEAEMDALREKQRWIPVKEKTPEYDMPQLALNADGDSLIANYAYGEWFDAWGQDAEVTHWMPLPEARRVKKNGNL